MSTTNCNKQHLGHTIIVGTLYMFVFMYLVLCVHVHMYNVCVCVCSVRNKGSEVGRPFF